MSNSIQRDLLKQTVFRKLIVFFLKTQLKHNSKHTVTKRGRMFYHCPASRLGRSGTNDLPFRLPRQPDGPLAREFRVRGLLCPTRCLQSHTARGCCVPSCRGVHSQLRPVPEGQPVNDDLNAACIQLVESSQVKSQTNWSTPTRPPASLYT